MLIVSNIENYECLKNSGRGISVVLYKKIWMLEEKCMFFRLALLTDMNASCASCRTCSCTECTQEW